MSESENATTLLALHELGLRQNDGALALDRFSLNLVRGERVVVLGERGSGKEALLHLLGGYTAKDETLLGSVAVGDSDPMPADAPWQARLAIAYLPAARSLPFAPHVSILKQLCRAAAQALHAPVASAREELRLVLSRHPAAPSLDALDVKPGDADAAAIGWGLLALAACRSPDLVLADHVFSDLGPKASSVLLTALVQEQERSGFALLYATGSMHVVARIDGRVVVLRRGRIVEEGTRAKLASGQAHAYTRTLFRAMPRLQPDQTPVRARSTMRGQPLLQVSGLIINKPKKQPKARVIYEWDPPPRPQPGMSMEVARGGAVAFVGEEGSGRKAMARAFLGLDPVYRGRVLFDAVDIGVLSQEMRGRLRRRIAFITGSDETLDPGMSLAETVEEPLRTYLGISGELIAGYRESALKRVGLASLKKNTPVNTLSPFDRRRLQIARALVASPLLAVIDEPLLGLDAYAQGVMRELLADMRAQLDAGFLVITADFSVAQSLASEVLVFEGGKVVERGAMATVLNNPQSETARSLIDAVRL